MQLLTLFLAIVPIAQALKFDLAATSHGAERCIRNFVAKDTLVITTAILSGQAGDGQTVNIYIRDSNGNDHGRARDVHGEKRIAFTSTADTAFDVCFENQLINRAGYAALSRHVELDIEIGADAQDWSKVQAQQKLQPIEADLKHIEANIVEISNELEYLRDREVSLRDTNESTNERVKWFALGTMGMLVALGAWQVIYLRAYFRSKHLI